MRMRVARLDGANLNRALDDLARLRIAVFRAFPYLYDGDAANEARYLQTYRDNPQAVLVAAQDDADQIVGAATGMPLAAHSDAAEMTGALPPIKDCFYCAESVLLPEYRGRGLGHAFFDQREQFARAQGFTFSLFCGVVRPPDHPLRPDDYRLLDPFWRKRGYAPLEGAFARFSWRDIDQDAATEKPLQVWIKRL